MYWLCKEIFRSRDETWFSMHWFSILGPEGGVETQASKGKGTTLPQGPSIHVCKCIRKSCLITIIVKTFLSYNNTQKCWRKCFKQFLFPVPIMSLKSIIQANSLKMLLPGQMITSFWCHEITFAAVHITDDDIRFCNSPRMFVIEVKPQSCVLPVCKLPC